MLKEMDVNNNNIFLEKSVDIFRIPIMKFAQTTFLTLWNAFFVYPKTNI